jgi:hypothetical protein
MEVVRAPACKLFQKTTGELTGNGCDDPVANF